MKEWVDLEGSGPGVTKLVGAVPTGNANPTAAVVIGSNNSEVRMLSVDNIGNTGLMRIAILNINNSPTLRNITASSGPDIWVVGIYNVNASPQILGVTVNARSAYVDCIGIENLNSSPILADTTVSTERAGSGYWGAGVRVRGTSSAPVMSNLVVSASWTAGGGNNTGVLVLDASSATLANSTITASGGAAAVALFAGMSNSEIIVDRSTLSGGNSLHTGWAAPPYSVKIGASKLDGPVVLGTGNHACAGVYNGSYSIVGTDCQ